MLRCDDLTRPGLEPGMELTTPRAVFEGPALPRCLLNGSDVVPCLVVTRTVATMRCIEDPKLCLARCVQDTQHVRNAAIGFRDGPNAGPRLATLGNEVVIRIDHQKRRDLLVI